MVEFLPVFLLTLIFLVLLVVFMGFGRTPTYRPERQEVRDLLAGIFERKTSQEAWDMFLGLPILHDPELEEIRRRCIQIHEGTDGQPAAHAGLGGYLYDRAGRERLKPVLEALDDLIRKTPVYREF